MTITNYKEKQNDYPVMKKIVNFLTAGLVDYSDVDDGKYLLRKEAIDRMLPTLEGRPLVIGHQKIDPDHIDDVAVGYITKGYWNPETGSFDCDVLVKDAEILNPSKNAVSCAYVATEFGEGGRYSGIDYDAEILNGEFTHIALVDNPRYNDAKILVNGLKKGANMMIKRFFSNADDEKKAEDEKKENEDETKELSPEDVVTVGDKDVTIKELVDAYMNACKNEDKDDKKNEDKDNEDEKDNEDDDKDNEDDKKENEDDEKKNAEVSESIKEYVANAIKNALKKNEEEKKDNEDKDEKQNSLSLAAMLRDYSSQEKSFETRAERIAESNKKYGL